MAGEGWRCPGLREKSAQWLTRRPTPEKATREADEFALCESHAELAFARSCMLACAIRGQVPSMRRKGFAPRGENHFVAAIAGEYELVMKLWRVKRNCRGLNAVLDSTI